MKITTRVRPSTDPDFDADTIHVEIDGVESMRVYVYESSDGVPLVQIDTNINLGRMRIEINDGPVYDADPETNIGPFPQMLDRAVQEMSTGRYDIPIGRCQHCNIGIFDNPGYDRALESMSHLCWRCVKPHGVTYPTTTTTEGK